MKTFLTLLLSLLLVSCSQTPPRYEATPAPRSAAATRVRPPTSEPARTMAAITTAPAPAIVPETNAPVTVAPTNAPVPRPPVTAAPGTTPPPLPPAGVAGSVNTPPPITIPSPDEIVPVGLINFKSMPLDQVLEVYEQFVQKTLLRPANLPQAQITLKTQTPLTRKEVISALDAVLGMNGIAMIPMTDKFVKVVPNADAPTAGPPPDNLPLDQYPAFGRFATHVAQLKFLKPSEIVPALAPFARNPASILPIEDNRILVLRDYTENIKRMLEMIDKIDVAIPTEFISEVIPIKYAKASEIADALNSLSTGGSTTPIGAGRNQRAPAGAIPRQQPGGGFPGGGGMGGGYGGFPGANPMSQEVTPMGLGTPGAAVGTGTGTFQNQLQRIVQRASTQGELQIIGATKMIADERSNSLLIFATKSDMEMIKNIIAKIDVVLAQVLIESIIMDVQMDNGWSFGVSGAQPPQRFGDDFIGAGGANNTQPFFDFLSFLTGAATNTFFPGALPSSFTYWGKIGETFDFALQAAASDSRVNVIQKPRILTSHATPGQIFVGDTVPYISTAYYGGGFGGGPSSSFQQLSVGIGITVTPFINQDGLVVMQIDQTIDEISGSTTIAGVGDVPNTTHRTISAEVAVKDGDSVILGGFIRNSTNKRNSGVPILKDIPIIGPLFATRSSTKERNELIVIMRPTVLRTPEIAALASAEERKRLPGVSGAEAEIAVEERKQLIREQKRIKEMEHSLERLERRTQPKTAE